MVTVSVTSPGLAGQQVIDPLEGEGGDVDGVIRIRG